jgi:hypothetical protein
VACHPAQTAKFPTDSVRTATIAPKRLADVITYVECGTAAAMSNPAVRVGKLGRGSELPGSSRWSDGEASRLVLQ